ncbi:MAG: adenine-specific methyltransferase EcoRI family protein [Oscillospiraceae bacterium]|nr:adenine-specific methyltransferase EcoRI family protein [Oscillospiraceae bacterium]
MGKERRLNAAAKAKKDEFYTQLTDIEKELRHYRKHFMDKTVFCNCDDPFESNFFKYFVLNFNRLGLKKLIATCYYSSPIAGQQLQYHYDENGQMSFSFGDESKIIDGSKRPYKAVVTQVYDKTGDGGVDMVDVAELFIAGENQLTELKGDGDFRSEECLALLDEADIVVTNPPFSLFREYVRTLMEHNKNFIIIGNQNAITYKEFFPYLRDNKIWLGNGFAGNVGFFTSPYEDVAVSSQHKEGMIRVSGVMWFTNLDIKKRHEELILVKRYVPELYPCYENYDAINIDRTTDIPCDYAGVMGVPITFMDKYSPDQFEIIGLGIANLGLSIGVRPYKPEHKVYRKEVQKRGAVDGDLYMLDEHGNPVVPYARVLIRNKHPEQPKGGQN